MVEEVKIGKHTSYVRKDGRYYYREHNPYTGGVSLAEIKFDENGICEKFYTSSHCCTTVEKEKVDILFLTDGREIDEN